MGLISPMCKLSLVIPAIAVRDCAIMHTRSYLLNSLYEHILGHVSFPLVKHYQELVPAVS